VDRRTLGLERKHWRKSGYPAIQSFRRSSSGGLTIFVAMRRASPRVRKFAPLAARLIRKVHIGERLAGLSEF
jgi:hypothetical protein